MNIVRFIYGNSQYSDFLRTVLLRCRFYYPYNLYFMRKSRKNPTEQMLKARNLYSENKGRIRNICNCLSDQKSVDTYQKLIHMRQYYDVEDIPEYNYFSQYFPEDIKGFLISKNEEVFVDCGAFNGDTVMAFIKRFPNYHQIVAFEPDERNITCMKRKLHGYKYISVIKAGCSNRNGSAYLNLKQDPGSNFVSEDVSQGKAVQIALRKIDCCKACKNASWIKMDIEGLRWMPCKELKRLSEGIIQN